jgi:hypothetical protein
MIMDTTFQSQAYSESQPVALLIHIPPSETQAVNFPACNVIAGKLLAALIESELIRAEVALLPCIDGSLVIGGLALNRSVYLLRPVSATACLRSLQKMLTKHGLLEFASLFWLDSDEIIWRTVRRGTGQPETPFTAEDLTRELEAGRKLQIADTLKALQDFARPADARLAQAAAAIGRFLNLPASPQP